MITGGSPAARCFDQQMGTGGLGVSGSPVPMMSLEVEVLLPTVWSHGPGLRLFL